MDEIAGANGEGRIEFHRRLGGVAGDSLDSCHSAGGAGAGGGQRAGGKSLGRVHRGATIPIALFMGGYLRGWRVGKVLEASAIGVVLLLLAVWGGQYVYQASCLGGVSVVQKRTAGLGIIVYGFAASVLPIWLLLAPRDYLSTFMKLGTIFLLALGIFVLLPNIRMPALTPFGASGHGPVFAGKLFPFCFITIACGAISGFHSLIASGTTPKILTREGYARPIGYGAMCLESLVAIMALIAACTLEPGVYFSMNIKGAPAETVAKVSALGYDASLEKMNGLAAMTGEKRFLAVSVALRRWPSGWPRFFPGCFTVPGWTCGTTSRSCSRPCSS
jgi:carbon starvation protein